MDWYKTVACQEIDKQSKDLFKLGNNIWKYSNCKWKSGKDENKTVKCITKFLKKNNFRITYNLNGMPLTFKAEYGASSSPGNKRMNVVLLCRYDVMGKVSQFQGNRLVAEAAIAAALGVKAVLQLSCPTIGKVTVIGCPDSQEGGLATLVNLKVFKNADIVMGAIPGPRTDWAPRFKGRKTFQAIYKGSGELNTNSFPKCEDKNACMLAYQNVTAVQEHFGKDWKLKVTMWRKRLPNHSCVVICTSAPTTQELMLIENRVVPCLVGASKSSGCECEVLIAQKTFYSFVPNVCLTYLLQLNAYYCGTLATPLRAKPIMKPVDVGNVSHIIPTLLPMFYIGTDAELDTEEFDHAIHTSIAHVNTLSIAKSLAMTAVDVLVTPSTVDEIKEELQRSLAKERRVTFKPFNVQPPKSTIQTPLPFEGNVGWSKQP